MHVLMDEADRGMSHPHHNPRMPARARLRKMAAGLLGVLLLVGWLHPFHAQADTLPPRIVILQSAAGGPYEKFTRQFLETLAQHDPGAAARVSIKTNAETLSDQLSSLNTHDLLIAVGTEATQTALQNATHTRILSVLIPRLTIEQLLRSTRPLPPHVAVIYLDQPLARYFTLLRLVLPNARSIAALLGPVTAAEAEEVQRAAHAAHYTPQLAVMPAGSDNPLPALANILQGSDALLALPDPVVYNRYTLPPLLLTTFRYRIPVIGFSRALVNAGALAGVYSTPEQIGQQAAELALQAALPQHGVYPRYFEVHFNQAVAQALNIGLPDKNKVMAQLQNAAGTP